MPEGEVKGELIIPIDGISYHALLEGPPSPQQGGDPLVLLVHALMSNMNMWDSTVKALHSAGYTTLRFNHIGHSTTPAPPAPSPPSSSSSSSPASAAYSMDDLVRHMHSLVETATGQRKVEAVIGCSIGGVLALRYAMLFPTAVKKIISIAAPGIATPEKAKQLWRERVSLFEEDVYRTGGESLLLCHATVERWFPGNLPRDWKAREVSLGHVKGCSLEGYRILAEAISGYDYDEEVEGMEGRVKYLVVAGSDDGAIDVEGLRSLAGRIPGGGAEFVCMQGGGHLPPLQMKEEFEGIMMDFLRKE